jgi:serine/threonine-protein kinase
VIKKGLEIFGFLALVFVIWLILFALMDMVVMPIYTHQNREAEVPDLFEMRFQQAQTVAEQHGFQVTQAEKRFGSNYPVGIVIEQSPAPYTISKLGRKINVVVSGGVEKVTVPDVVGVSEKEASFKLESAGLKFDEAKNTKVYSGYYPPGVVINQHPPANSILQKGAVVILEISKGAEPPFESNR